MQIKELDMQASSNMQFFSAVSYVADWSEEFILFKEVFRNLVREEWSLLQFICFRCKLRVAKIIDGSMELNFK